MPPKCKINLMFIDPLVICRLLTTYLNSLTYAYNMIYSVALKKNTEIIHKCKNKLYEVEYI